MNAYAHPTRAPFINLHGDRAAPSCPSPSDTLPTHLLTVLAHSRSCSSNCCVSLLYFPGACYLYLRSAFPSWPTDRPGGQLVGQLACPYHMAMFAQPGHRVATPNGPHLQLCVCVLEMSAVSSIKEFELNFSTLDELNTIISFS